MEYFELSPETANPKAKALLVDDFYWSTIEESGPFGSDDGSDAFYGFREWRLTNEQSSPLLYLQELFESWGYPYFDVNEMNVAKIEEYISPKSQLDSFNFEMPVFTEEFKKLAKATGMELNEEKLKEIASASSHQMGDRYLVGLDDAIIAVGFGQFVLEGKIDEDIKTLTQTAIKRELLPILVERYDEEYKDIRKEQLNKMLAVVDKMNA